MIRNLEDIWFDITAGDIVLKQRVDQQKNYDKTELVIIVGIDVYDMALTVHYTNYKTFCLNRTDEIKVRSYSEWDDEWSVLGHWKTMPTFRELLNAKRKEI